MYLSLNILEEAVQSKSRLEALAFCMQVKGVYSSSALHYTRARGDRSHLEAVCRVFSIGKVKLSRLIKNGLKYGYLRQEGDLIIANKITAKDYKININIESYNKANDNIRIQKMLQKAFIVNHIRKVEYVAHTFIRARGRITDLKQLKSRKKNIARWEKELERCGVKKNSKVSGRISYETLAGKCNITRQRAILLVNELIEEGIISKEYFFKEQKVFFEKNELADKIYLDKVQGNSRQRGYLRRFFNPITNKIGLFIQLSNIYRVLSDSNYNLMKNYVFKY